MEKVDERIRRISLIKNRVKSEKVDNRVWKGIQGKSLNKIVERKNSFKQNKQVFSI